MNLTAEQVEFYKQNGYLLIENIFSSGELALLGEHTTLAFAEEGDQRVFEADGLTVRSVYGSHFKSEIFRKLTRDPRLILPAQQLLSNDLYLYQFKINGKRALKGDMWEWHQDFAFWRQEDGMREPLAITAAIFLDEVTDLNGPMIFIPGSHSEGLLSGSKAAEGNDSALDLPAYKGQDRWITNLTASLKYTIELEELERLIKRYGYVAPKAKSGSILLFHSCIAHASTMNMSPKDRKLIMLTYNCVSNIPEIFERPEFLVSRDTRRLDVGKELIGGQPT